MQQGISPEIAPSAAFTAFTSCEKRLSRDTKRINPRYRYCSDCRTDSCEELKTTPFRSAVISSIVLSAFIIACDVSRAEVISEVQSTIV